MIPREKVWILFSTCILLLIVEVKLQESGRAYDTNDWIPVTPTALRATTSKDVEQSASDRVLSVDVPSQKFFPDEEYEYRKRPNQVQQFVRESPVRKGVEHPRPRKLKHPLEYKFERPPPPPSQNQPEINYYNGQNMSPYLFEQSAPPRGPKPVTQQTQQSYTVPVQQVPNKRPFVNSYVAVPNINPQVPSPNAPNLYEQYQLPFNASFYQSLNPASLNNELYQAINSNSQNVQQKLTANPRPSTEEETVQLVYVPVENLQTSQPSTLDTKSNYQQVVDSKLAPSQASQVPNFEPIEQPRHEALVYKPSYLQQRPESIYQQVNAPRQEKLTSFRDFPQNKQHRLENIQQDFAQQALQAHKLQAQLQDDINPLKQDIFTTTPKSNRKPHQPPLAVFMESQKKAEISDVLDILKDAKSISVQDAVTRDSPKIFVGPSNLDSPDGYTKFPLPYLNNINGNRIERKIDQLPFFVAPVSYKTPPGYAKIPLPSPHVGSVVVSVPATGPTTPEPILIPQQQLNPFTFSTNGYSPLDNPTSARPIQNYLNNYENSGQGRVRYQSTPAPQTTDPSLIPPVSDIFGSQFTPPQPDVYYPQQNNQQTHRDNAPILDIYGQQLQENNRYTTAQENRKSTPSPVPSTDSSYEISQLPNVNPLELAINEFELHQINNEFEKPNKKVKHSTTRRPPNKNDFEDNQTVSSTRAAVSRGRQTFETEPTTERTTSRGRIRGRGKGSSSRTVGTTPSTTSLPVNNDRYTILEEFAAREPTRSPSTESYGRFSTEVETNAPRISTTPLSRNAYLPEQSSEVRRPQAINEYSRSQTSLDGTFENRRVPTFENSPVPSVNEGFEERQKIDQTNINQQAVFHDTQSAKLENPRTKSVIINNKERNSYPEKNTEIENIPASVYSLGAPQTYDSTAFDFDSTKNTQEPTSLFYENVQGNENEGNLETERLTPEQARPTPSHRFSPDVISYENREPNQQLRPQKRPQYQEYDINVNNEPVVNQEFQPEIIQRPSSEVNDQVFVEQTPKQQTINDPTEFLENLNQPNFDQTYLSLQDQAVRSLLVPNLLPPSSKQQLLASNSREQIISSTETIVEIPSSTEAEITTTTRASRTRGRGRARPSATSASVTSSPRRTVSRRRPASRPTTERITSSTEYSSREDTQRSSSNAKEHFKVRGRPVPNEITDRISTAEDNIASFKEPVLEGGFESIKSREPPQSYMQFEHAIDEQQIITINPNLNQETEVKNYHQVYSLPSQTATEREQYIVEYENTRLRPTPVLDVQVSHAVPEENRQTPDVIATPTESEQYLRYNNIRSGGVLNNNKPATTTRVPTTKAKGRTRGRSRFASTTKATSRPVARISTLSPLRTTTATIEEQENYGFIRQPTHSQKNKQAQISVQTSSRNNEPVHFVGEIRPKYTSRKTTFAPSEESDSAETPRPRIRAKTRAPIRQATNAYRQSDNDANSSKSSEQVTRKSSNTRGKVRGSTHYKAQDYQKRESDDEDVASQNYPVNFLQKLDVSSTPTSAEFKITIDPLEEDVDDQSPHPSIYIPKFVAKPDGWSNFNALAVEDKKIKPEEIASTEFTEIILSTEEPQALPMVQTTETSEELFTQFSDAEVKTVMMNLEKIETLPTEEIFTTLEPFEKPSTTQKSGRRRGSWKLVKQRPIDPLEVSESQNFHSVLNVFDSIEKVDPYSKSDENRFSGKDSFEKGSGGYNEFKMEIKSLNEPISENQSFEDPKDVEEVVTVVSDDSSSTEYVTKTNVDDHFTTSPSTFKTQENIFNTIYDMFGIFNKPEEKRNETSTVEVSESSDKETPTTIVNPVFPEEITEESSTTYIGKEADKEKGSSGRAASTEKILTTTPVEKHVTKPYEVEPWEMKAVKTSTSTEVSHETEICYKGRCVKSKEKKKLT